MRFSACRLLLVFVENVPGCFESAAENDPSSESSLGSTCPVEKFDLRDLIPRNHIPLLDLLILPMLLFLADLRVLVQSDSSLSCHIGHESPAVEPN